jgi:large subunit ribosomal protein L4
MATVTVYNQERAPVGEAVLDDAVWGVPVREHLLYAAVRYQRAKARQGTHQVKGRSDVRGGGRKPWKQKGTGRARQGSTRSPQWRGGGVVFGPTSRDHGFKLNKSVRRLALCCALSARVGEQKLLLLEDLALPEIRTRQVVDLMKRFEIDDMLLVVEGLDETVVRSARNLGTVTVLPTEGVNVTDVLKRRNLVLTRRAVDALTARLGA